MISISKYIVISLTLVALWTAPCASHADDGSLSFAAAVDALDPMKNTSLGIKAFWQGWKGRQVTWNGSVHDVQVGRTHQKIYIANSDRPTYRGYNVVLSISDYNHVALLKKGQQILFSGILHRYTARRGNPVVISLERGELKGVAASPEPPPPLSPAPASAPAQEVNTPPSGFGEFVDRIDCKTNTRLASKSNWALLKGVQVSWSGEVSDVKAGRGRAEVYIANRQKTLYRGYNIILVTYDLKKAALLKKGQSVKFSGLPERYSCRPGVPTVITLRNGQILSD
jgi:hypothetical protein